jgi:hypothetical protein
MTGAKIINKWYTICTVPMKMQIFTRYYCLQGTANWHALLRKLADWNTFCPASV